MQYNREDIPQFGHRKLVAGVIGILQLEPQCEVFLSPVRKAVDELR
jgi:hypothetical protein